MLDMTGEVLHALVRIGVVIASSEYVTVPHASPDVEGWRVMLGHRS